MLRSYPESFITLVKFDRLLQVLCWKSLQFNPGSVAYTECINLLNYSVCVIPVSTANKDIDVFDKDYRPLNETDRKNWEACKSRFSKKDKPPPGTTKNCNPLT